MAHVRSDCFTSPPEWWRHLRPWNKRKVSKSERRASKEQIAVAIEDAVEETPKGLGLNNDPRKMEWLRKTAGVTMIPHGDYCYNESGSCPYWDSAENKPEQMNGYCWFMGKGDWCGTDLLFDQCKECGENETDVPEGCFPAMEEEGHLV